MSGRFDSPLKSGQRGTRAITRREKVAPGFSGFKTINEGLEDFEYEVNIDWKDVAQMAWKAAHNQSGQSIAGPIQIKITKRTRRTA